MLVLADLLSWSMIRVHTLLFLLVSDWTIALHVGNLCNAAEQRTTSTAPVRVRADEVVGEAGLERYDALQVLDLLVGELNLKGLDVGVEVLDLAAADEREDVGRFGHDVCQGHGSR